MLFHTLGQPFVMAVCVLTGAAIGVVYDLCKAVRIAFGGGRFVTAICDLIFAAAFFVLLLAGFYFGNLLYIEWYMIPCAAAGGALYWVGARKPLLFCQRMIYNIRTKLFGKRADDGKRERQNH
ncbi:MAG: spore cortex biosynthesis protein YabQ [Eubacteriales bacterium]|nr:spore cortex biosynthesis protein YabQ [Eubacteriales bacterium]